jgi:LPPG:FO 2-phospho-L-lactate transferase
VHGLYDILPPNTLTVIVNTANDFQHLSLSISPDLDTVLYTLGGRADAERSRGRTGDTWNFMAALDDIGGETWFKIGDLDVAMHVLRTHWLQWGRPLSAFAEHVAGRYGIAARIVPMSDDTVSMWFSTEDGLIPFQQYYIKERCEPAIKGVHFEGAAHARPAPHILSALRDSSLKAIVICPSNPYLGIDPILAIPDVQEAIEEATCPVVAVSPIIAGKAVTGPAAKIMTELGFPTSWATITSHYCGVADGLLIHEGEAQEVVECPMVVESAPILMKTLEDQRQLAEIVLSFAARLGAKRSGGGSSPPPARRRCYLPF